jgi:hypothetical protein
MAVKVPISVKSRLSTVRLQRRLWPIFILPHLGYTAEISATWHPKFIGDVVRGGVNIYCPLPYCVTQEIFHTGQCSPLSMKTDSFERYRWGRQRTLLSLTKNSKRKIKFLLVDSEHIGV